MAPWTVACQALSVHGSLQARILEWSPFSSPGDLPNPGVEPEFPVLLEDLYIIPKIEKILRMEFKEQMKGMTCMIF